MHACALRKDGQVLCWGSNTLGELGAGLTGSSVSTPQPVRWDLL
jgi:alpha-tubulin suppressor-like RCC1 family protein